MTPYLATLIEGSYHRTNTLALFYFGIWDARVCAAIRAIGEVILCFPKFKEKLGLASLYSQMRQQSDYRARRFGARHVPRPQRPPLGNRRTLQVERASECFVQKMRHFRGDLLEADHFVMGRTPPSPIADFGVIDSNRKRTISVNCTSEVCVKGFTHTCIIPQGVHYA